MATAGCGSGWTHPQAGHQLFELHNTSSTAAEVYLTDPTTGAVYGEVEGLAPGTVRPLGVTLGNGSYAFKCLPDDADAVTGPTVRITGSKVKSGPAAVPITQQELIPPTLAHQKWIQGRTVELAQKTDVLRAAVDHGDLAAARKAWLPAHLVYERMGAAYGTFGDSDGAINGTTAGLLGGVRDTGFTGFHRVEYGLWHGEPASALRGPADQLAKDVHALESSWPSQRMDPFDTGLRAHEILENTVQFELTGRTDYGSGTNLATARANLDGTRVLLGYLAPLLKTRDASYGELGDWMDREALVVLVAVLALTGFSDTYGADTTARHAKSAAAAGHTPAPYYGLQATLVCVRPVSADRRIPITNGPLPTGHPVVFFDASEDGIHLWDPARREARNG